LLSGHCIWSRSHGPFFKTGPHISFTALVVGHWITITEIQTLSVLNYDALFVIVSHTIKKKHLLSEIILVIAIFTLHKAYVPLLA
jgi:hypothetical protein